MRLSHDLAGGGGRAMIAFKVLVAASAFGLLLASTAIAAPLTLITFDDLPNADTVVTNQYESLGVRFSLVDSPLAGPLIPPDRLRSNVIVPSADYISGAFDYDMQIDFLRPAVFASINVLDAEEPFSIRAYLNGVQVATASVQSLGRGPGGPEFLATVQGVSFDRLLIDLTNDLGSGAGGPEAYDDLRFELAPVAVPEPATLCLLGLAAAAAAFVRRRPRIEPFEPHP